MFNEEGNAFAYVADHARPIISNATRFAYAKAAAENPHDPYHSDWTPVECPDGASGVGVERVDIDVHLCLHCDKICISESGSGCNSKSYKKAPERHLASSNFPYVFLLVLVCASRELHSTRP